MDKLIEAEAKCAHKRVVHRPMPIEGGLWADRWYCDLCKSEFTPLAAVEKLCQQQHEALLAYRQRDDCHCPTCRQADAALTAYAALFPKTGGAK